MDGDRVVGFDEEHPVVADTQAQETFKLATERLDSSGAGLGIAVNRSEDRYRCCLVDGANLFRNSRLQVNRLH